MPVFHALSDIYNLSKNKQVFNGIKFSISETELLTIRGGFELGLTYSGFLDRNNSSLNAVLCPRF